jgi:hypothetical protein
MTKNYLSFMERVEIMNFLKTVTTEKNDKGFVRYAEGYSDKVVADKFGTADHMVRAVRQESIGNLDRTGPRPQRANTKKMQLQELQQDVKGLSTAISILNQRLQACEKYLHIDPVKVALHQGDLFHKKD